MTKVRITRYKDAEGRVVPKGTPGAQKIVNLSDKWYAEWRVNGQKRRQPLSTDKTVSQKMLGDLILELEKGKAGLHFAFKDELLRPISEHVADFLADLKKRGVSEKYASERDRCLQAVISGCRAKTLADLTVDRVDHFLESLNGAARTKDIYRAAALGFCNWLVRKNRLEFNLLARTTKPDGKVVRVRRALKPEELQNLLDTTRARPIKEFSIIRRGKRKGQQVANLRDEVRERLTMLGRERALIYKIAIYTGLRRGEIAALRVAHLSLDAKPFRHLILPGEFTKNGGEAKLLLVPSYAEELRAWIQDARKQGGDLLFAVRNEMVKTLKADLAAAGIKYRDEQGRVVDFHALRMTADTMLGLAGVPPRVRMLFMRHSDIRLTMQTYDDSSLYELESAVKALDKLGLR